MKKSSHIFTTYITDEKIRIQNKVLLQLSNQKNRKSHRIIVKVLVLDQYLGKKILNLINLINFITGKPQITMTMIYHYGPNKQEKISKVGIIQCCWECTATGIFIHCCQEYNWYNHFGKPELYTKFECMYVYFHSQICFLEKHMQLEQKTCIRMFTAAFLRSQNTADHSNTYQECNRKVNDSIFIYSQVQKTFPVKSLSINILGSVYKYLGFCLKILVFSPTSYIYIYIYI